MTIQRKQKQAVRSFMAEHGVTYQEALRLTHCREIEATIRGEDGTIYSLWIEGGSLELSWQVSEAQSAVCAGSLWSWMTGSSPGDQGSEPANSFYDSAGRVRAAAGSESLHGSMPWLSASVAAKVREHILRSAPSWAQYDQHTLDAIGHLVAEGDSADSYFLTRYPMALPQPVVLTEDSFSS